MDIKLLLAQKIKNNLADGPYLLKFSSNESITDFCNSLKENICGRIDHPDFLDVIKNKEDREYKVDSKEIEHFFKFIQFNPIQLRKKIIFFFDADHISTIVANKLLKTLEEANQHNLIILLSQSKKDLLPTIESRCIKINLPNLMTLPTKKKNVISPFSLSKDEIEEKDLIEGKIDYFLENISKSKESYLKAEKLLNNLKEYSENQIYNNSKIPRVTPFFD